MFCIETELLAQMDAISSSIISNQLDPLKKWMYENAHMIDKF